MSIKNFIMVKSSTIFSTQGSICWWFYILAAVVLLLFQGPSRQNWELWASWRGLVLHTTSLQVIRGTEQRHGDRYPRVLLPRCFKSKVPIAPSRDVSWDQYVCTWNCHFFFSTLKYISSATHTQNDACDVPEISIFFFKFLVG